MPGDPKFGCFCALSCPLDEAKNGTSGTPSDTTGVSLFQTSLLHEVSLTTAGIITICMYHEEEVCGLWTVNSGV